MDTVQLMRIIREDNVAEVRRRWPCGRGWWKRRLRRGNP